MKGLIDYLKLLAEGKNHIKIYQDAYSYSRLIICHDMFYGICWLKNVSAFIFYGIAKQEEDF